MSALVTVLAAAAPLLAGEDLAGHWEGHLVRADQAYVIRLDISRDDGAYEMTLDLPGYLLYGCPVEIDEMSAGTVLRPTLIDGDIRGTFTGGRFTGTASVVAPESRIELVRYSRHPVRFRHEEIRFRSGDGDLAGTLVLPPGAGPFPAIVWTHGSGPDTRRTFYYHGRAHLLARHGVAGFIYDKRGAGASTGSDPWKTGNLVADAVAAIRAIKDREDIDDTRLGIAGFSQGGWVAPEVALREDDVDFVVVGATPGITGGEQNAFSLLNALRRDGYSEENAQAARDLLMRLYRYYETGRDRDAIVHAMDSARREPWFDEPVFQRMLFLPDGELPQGANPYWKPLSPDPLEVWSGVTVPVLSMWGALDRQVPAERSRDVLEQAFRAAGNDDVTLAIFPGASHGFWVVRGESERWDWPRQAPGCHSAIVEWVLAHTRVPD